ncbi:hypothetical protein F2P81_015559 [Scophthalmus maximus]|uniref:Uncharacterized protein n=1 Tax=Scophthalmus maximus TaxID=52904 RepID=A0A6A4SKZ9_SCOMX|nr:hypothetical protein F2P81_015559 [Scophthalmus maximus]
MSLRFTDEEFQAAWRELDEPQLGGGWELFTETMGVRIHRLLDKVRTTRRQPALPAAVLPRDTGAAEEPPTDGTTVKPATSLIMTHLNSVHLLTTTPQQRYPSGQDGEIPGSCVFFRVVVYLSKPNSM